MDVERKKLVFRLGGMGFSLPIEALLEIREGAGGWIDRSAGVPDEHLLGELRGRDGRLPVFDLRGLFHTVASSDADSLVVLVLYGLDGPWGGVADSIEGIFPAGEFTSRSLPLPFRGEGDLPYGSLDFWRGEALVALRVGDLDRLREAA